MRKACSSKVTISSAQWQPPITIPYYPQHMERMGFEKDADWVEYKIYIPDAIPDKHKRISELIQRKYNLKIKKYSSAKKIAHDYGQAIF